MGGVAANDAGDGSMWCLRCVWCVVYSIPSGRLIEVKKPKRQEILFFHRVRTASFIRGIRTTKGIILKWLHILWFLCSGIYGSFHPVQLIGLPVRLATELGSVAGLPALVENWTWFSSSGGNFSILIGIIISYCVRLTSLFGPPGVIWPGSVASCQKKVQTEPGSDFMFVC